MIFNNQEHIQAAKTAASRFKLKTGFFCWPSASLAQAQLESAGWTILSGKNNGFGIKATPAQIKAGQYTMCPTHEIIDGRRVTINAPFANYDSLADAYEAHAELFVRVKLYSSAVSAKTARQFVIEMAQHYATAEKDPDPKKRYSYILLGMMDKYNLYQYDGTASVVSANTVAGQPSSLDKAKAKAPAVAGAVVIAGGAIASASQYDYTPLAIGAVVGLLALGFAAWAYAKAHEKISSIPSVAAVPEILNDVKKGE